MEEDVPNFVDRARLQHTPGSNSMMLGARREIAHVASPAPILNFIELRIEISSPHGHSRREDCRLTVELVGGVRREGAMWCIHTFITDGRRLLFAHAVEMKSDSPRNSLSFSSAVRCASVKTACSASDCSFSSRESMTPRPEWDGRGSVGRAGWATAVKGSATRCPSTPSRAP